MWRVVVQICAKVGVPSITWVRWGSFISVGELYLRTFYIIFIKTDPVVSYEWWKYEQTVIFSSSFTSQYIYIFFFWVNSQYIYMETHSMSELWVVMI